MLFLLKNESKGSQALVIMRTSELLSLSGHRSAIVLDGNLHLSDSPIQQVKVKLHTELDRFQRELSNMRRLHTCHPEQFVKPIAFARCDRSLNEVDELPWSDVSMEGQLPIDARVKSVLVMEKGEGDMSISLDEIIPEHVNIKLSRLHQMVQIVLAASKKGVVLCDLKWSNLVLFRTKVNMVIKAIDLDSAYNENSFVSFVPGTWHTMAPEHARFNILSAKRGSNYEIRGNSDVWSLGVLSFHLFSSNHSNLWGDMNEDEIKRKLCLPVDELQDWVTYQIARYLDGVGTQIRGFITELLKVDSAKRKILDSIYNDKKSIFLPPKTTIDLSEIKAILMDIRETVQAMVSGYHKCPQLFVLICNKRRPTDIWSAITMMQDLVKSSFNDNLILYPVCADTHEPCGEGIEISSPKQSLSHVATALRFTYI